MSAHLAAEAAVLASPRPRLSGPNYCGLHRAPSSGRMAQPGALVLEPGSHVLSSVIRLVDAETALVRHVGSFDDHPVALSRLRPAGAQVRVGADFGDAD